MVSHHRAPRAKSKPSPPRRCQARPQEILPQSPEVARLPRRAFRFSGLCPKRLWFDKLTTNGAVNQPFAPSRCHRHRIEGSPSKDLPASITERPWPSAPLASFTYEGVVYYGDSLGGEAARFNEDGRTITKQDNWPRWSASRETTPEMIQAIRLVSERERKRPNSIDGLVAQSHVIVLGTITS